MYIKLCNKHQNLICWLISSFSISEPVLFIDIMFMDYKLITNYKCMKSQGILFLLNFHLLCLSPSIIIGK